ncbi:ribonuclease III [Candidatus Gracilibacteria bacterium]|nr:ribonuclease III [Candidatus Gracilibacteria bacterium]
MTDIFVQLSEVLAKLGITPRDISLYQTACVHRSFLNESPKDITTHNERLEFLGDAALELSMTHLIFHAFPDREEGWMTDLRSSYVRGTHLAAIALDYSLDSIILMSQGERNAGGAKNQNILADMFEAVLGALYVDQGFDAVHEVVKNIVFSSERVKTETKDPKSRLQETIQQHIKVTPDYNVLSEEGKDHQKVFTISASISGVTIGTGIGTNKKLAQEAAATDALQNADKWEHLINN